MNQQIKTNHGCFFVTTFVAMSAMGGFAYADPLNAGGGAIFRLDPPSALEYGCFPPCLCPIAHIDNLRGTMTLAHSGSAGGADVYQIDDVNWHYSGSQGTAHVTGQGQYSIDSPNPIGVVQHRLELDLSIDGAPEERFDSGWVPIEQNGGININISMNGFYCMDTAFLVYASRVPDSDVIHYALKPGSTFQRGCWDPCDCPITNELPMTGTFGLVPMSNDPSELEFAVVDIDLSVLDNNSVEIIAITGYGKYRNEPDIQRQDMSLALRVDNEPRTHYGSGDTVAGVPFPWIDVLVSINDLYCFDTALHIVADPDNDICGGIANIPCEAGDFCKLPIGACCCDHLGVCMPVQPTCPAVIDPVCGCDGITYGNECEADLAGVTVLHLGACGQVCGSDADCSDANQFCKRPIGACDDPTNVPGVCTMMPAACPEIYDPVCGCDEVTYSNECFADAARVSVRRLGPCEPVGACCLDIDDGPIAYDTCLSLTQTECDQMGGVFSAVNSACDETEACCLSFVGSEFCADMQPACCQASGGVPQGPGSSCQPVPEFCGGVTGIPCPVGYECVDDPDDNCDPNAGGADCLGVCVPEPLFCGGIANIPCPYPLVCVDDPTDNCDPDAGGADCRGVCTPEPPCGEICGGVGGIPCSDPSEFCKLPVGACCCDHTGRCEPIPGGCTAVWDPVCGCDGVTYENECEADVAGVTIAHFGECNVCEVSSDGSSCQPLACSAIPEEQCTPGVIHLDISTGALTVDECTCLDFNLCHIEFGNASPFAVGSCPNGGNCEVLADDTDNDGLADTFRTACLPDVACCAPLGHCTLTSFNACLADGGTPQAPGTSCSDAQCPKPGDCDHNGVLDPADIQDFINCLNGPANGPGSPNCDCQDLNQDGVIDLLDCAWLQLGAP